MGVLVPLLLHPFFSTWSPQARAAAATALPLPPLRLPQERPLSYRGSSASDGQLLGTLPAGRTTRGERRGPPAALPAWFFRTPVTSPRRQATPQGPGSVPFTCTTMCEGAAADGSPPVSTPRRDGRAGVREQERGSRRGSHGVQRPSGRRGTHRGHEDGEKWGTHMAEYTRCREGRGMGGSAGYCLGARGRG